MILKYWSSQIFFKHKGHYSISYIRGLDMTNHNEQATGKHKQGYWSRRQELVYYQYVRVLIEELTVEANSIIDVGSAETPILENLKWLFSVI